MAKFIKCPGKEGFEVGIQYGRYVIQLPHQCDEYVIADETSKEESIRTAEAFIAELMGAIEVLRGLPEENRG